MRTIERIYELHEILRHRRRGISGEELAERLGCSIATVKRTVRTMRERLGAPIENDRDRGGYYYAHDPANRAWELPGVWLTADELRALFTLEHVLEGLRPGLLAECLGPLRRRLEGLAVARGVALDEASQRIRVLEPTARSPGPCFRTVASAVLERRRLGITYRGRARGERTRREVSPQRLVHYRGGWYLDAWCHLRDDLRSFAVERIEQAKALDARARPIDDRVLDRFYASSYGIFSGEPRAWAVLVFDEHAARWVAEQVWHPRQQGRWLEDGRWELRVPYSIPDELVMDLLRWVPEVSVVEPDELRALLRERLRAGLEAVERGWGRQATSAPPPRRGRRKESGRCGSGSDPDES